MYYGEIKNCDIANGTGVRVTLFVSGCRNHCLNCFQQETWDFEYGSEFTEQTQEQLLDMLEPSYIDGLTVLGGEPFEPENQKELIHLLRRVRKELPHKDIWSYTGFVLDRDLLEGQRKHTDVTYEMLSYIDVLVDGPFIAEKKNLALYFRGSENQRVIDMNRTREEKNIILYHD